MPRCQLQQKQNNLKIEDWDIFLLTFPKFSSNHNEAGEMSSMYAFQLRISWDGLVLKDHYILIGYV